MDLDLQRLRRTVDLAPREAEPRLALARALARVSDTDEACCELWRAASLGAPRDRVQDELARLGALASPWPHARLHALARESLDAASRARGPRAGEVWFLRAGNYEGAAIDADGTFLARRYPGIVERIDPRKGEVLEEVRDTYWGFVVTRRGILYEGDALALPSGHRVSSAPGSDLRLHAPEGTEARELSTGLEREPGAEPFVIFAPLGADRFVAFDPGRLVGFTTGGERFLDRPLDQHACFVRACGERIFIASVAPGRVDALTATGEPVWQTLVPFEVANPYLIASRDGSVFFFDKREILRFDAAGAIAWRWRAPAPFVSAIVDREGVCYVANGTSVTALGLDGKKVFEVALGERAELHALDAWGRLIASAWAGGRRAELVLIE